MTVVLELQKEKIRIRKQEPIRASVLGAIIDGAKKIAKEDNREVTQDDITLSAKRNSKALNKVVTEVMQEMGVRKNDPMLSRHLQEIKITETFLPKALSAKETELVIIDIINNLPEDQRNIGRVMGVLKKAYKDLVDMGIASRIVKERLK